MQLVSMLLASSLICFLSFASATPFFHRRSPKLIHLPVKRCHHEPPKGLHSLIVFEQILNRSLQRLARMTGAQEIPREVLERNLMRRVLQVEGPDGLERRFKRRALDDTVVLDKRFLPAEVPAPAVLGKVLALGDEDAPDRDITPAEPPTAANSLGLDIESKDVSYMATIQIGTPPRNFSIVVDSGSSDLWVGSENCTSFDGRGGCGDHIFLGPTFSTSFVDSGDPWKIKYGLGNVTGTLVSDDISIANLSLPKHNFGVANRETIEFSSDDVAYDGIMGLGNSSLSNQNNPTPIDALLAAGLIDEPIVSYKMDRVRDKNNDGIITFGGLDNSKFDPKTAVTIPNVNKAGFWEAVVDDFAVGGKSLDLRGRTAILDTGTTLILAPENDTAVLHKAIPGAIRTEGGFLIPCNTTAVFSLTFGGRSFNIDSRDLTFVPAGRNRNFTSGFCHSGIASGSLFGAREWLVGATFLKNVYFSTNPATNNITLAELV